jgi:putative addiction module component (TIGR02574 family)
VRALDVTPSKGLAGLAGSWEIAAMSKDALLEEILRLPVAERLHLVEAIWDIIAAAPEELPLPDWHRAELDRRLAETAPEHLSWDEVRARLQQAS